MRMRRKKRLKQSGSGFRRATFSGRKAMSRSGGDDFERRRDSGDVPARVAFGIFVAGGKIDAALRVELVQQPAQAFFKRDLRKSAFDNNAAGCGITVGAHKTPLGSTQRISCGPLVAYQTGTLINSQ